MTVMVYVVYMVNRGSVIYWFSELVREREREQLRFGEGKTIQRLDD